MCFMGKCEFCGEEVELPFQCSFCNGYFCIEHRLPENLNSNLINQNSSESLRAGSSAWHERLTCTVAEETAFSPKENVRLSNNRESVNWSAFRKWLEKNFSHSYAKDIFNYSRKYSQVLFSGDGSVLLGLTDSVRKSVMASLANLSKYLGIYKEWKTLVENYGLKWSQGYAEDFIISRITNTDNHEGVIEWLQTVKRNLPKLSVFMDFTVLSGLRFREAVNSYNLIIDLAKEGRLNEYYDSEKEALEHFRFKERFIRKSKKVFTAFLPKQLIERITESEKLTRFQIESRIKRNGFSSRFGDIRQFWATFMTKHLTQPEIDFLQGRVSANVFMRNYFNPALITDLKTRIFQGIYEIQTKT